MTDRDRDATNGVQYVNPYAAFYNFDPEVDNPADFGPAYGGGGGTPTPRRLPGSFDPEVDDPLDFGPNFGGAHGTIRRQRERDFQAQFEGRTPEENLALIEEAFLNMDVSREGYRASVNQLIADEIAEINKDFERAISGGPQGATAAHRQAIQAALEHLRDVQANREAIKQVYAEYAGISQGFGDEAVEAALGVVAASQADRDEAAAFRAQGVEAAFDNAEGVVGGIAELIGAGDLASAEAVAENITGEALALTHGAAEAAEGQALIEMEQALLEEQAEADTARDVGRSDRRATETDTRFGQLQEQAADRLQSARAAAAAAAAARSRFLKAQRETREELIAAAREELGELDPLEAQLFGINDYLQANGRHVRPDRAVAVERAAYEFAQTMADPTFGNVKNYFTDPTTGVSQLTNDELHLITGAAHAGLDTMVSEAARQGNTSGGPFRGR